QSGNRVIAPLAEDNGDIPTLSHPALELPDLRHDTGAKERAFADAAMRVQEREPRHADVGDDRLHLALAPEEERRILFREVVQTYVRALDLRPGGRRRSGGFLRHACAGAGARAA